jgi:hypothetical protein
MSTPTTGPGYEKFYTLEETFMSRRLIASLMLLGCLAATRASTDEAACQAIARSNRWPVRESPLPSSFSRRPNARPDGLNAAIAFPLSSPPSAG